MIAAAEAKNLEIVQMISNAKGVDLNARNEDGLTALDVAAFNNNVEMVKYLLSLPGIEYKDLLKAESQLSNEVNKLIKSKQ